MIDQLLLEPRCREVSGSGECVSAPDLLRCPSLAQIGWARLRFEERQGLFACKIDAHHFPEFKKTLMNKRTLLAAAAAAAGMLLVGCASTNGDLMRDLPPGDNALVKRFKARVNLQFARLDLAFKNIASLSLIVSANPNREGLVREDYKKLERAYKELQKLSGQIDVVRASIKSEAVAAAFENYSQALLSITANPMGEIDEAKLNAMLKAASELEPVVD